MKRTRNGSTKNEIPWMGESDERQAMGAAPFLLALIGRSYLLIELDNVISSDPSPLDPHFCAVSGAVPHCSPYDVVAAGSPVAVKTQ